MKNKRNTGLRAGICRETQSTRGQTLLELLSAFLIFLALAAIFYTVSGFSAMLWLLGAGILTCIAAAVIRHFRKTKLLFPILLAALLLVVLFARNPLLNGFGAAWNTLRDLWAAEKGILLPLAETDDTGLWLAGIVAGILLAMVSVALSRVPTLTAVLMAALSVAAAFVQPDILLLFAAGISILLLSWQKHKNAVSAASFLLVGVIVAGVAAISLQTGTMQSLSENAKNALHYWRYEKREKSCRRAICPSRLQRQKAQIRFCLSRRIRRRRSICAASSVTATKTAYGLRWTRKPPQRKKTSFTGCISPASIRRASWQRLRG